MAARRHASFKETDVPCDVRSTDVKKMFIQTLLGDCPTWVIIGTQAKLKPTLEGTDEKSNLDVNYKSATRFR